MTLRRRKRDHLADVFRSQQEEIKKYKWIESEKVGRDIGWERAVREWMQNHFPNWKRDRWNRFVEEAIRSQDSLNQAHPTDRLAPRSRARNEFGAGNRD